MNSLFLTAVFSALSAFGHSGGEAGVEIGPKKGITDVQADQSFKLSPEAIENFGISALPVEGDTLSLPENAIVHVLEQSQIFRIRDGSFKAIGFEVRSKNALTWTIRSKELRPQDRVVTGGVGFLRIIASQLGETQADPWPHGAHHD